MIKNNVSYHKSKIELKRQEDFIKSERERFEKLGLNEEMVNQAVIPLETFKSQLEENIFYFEKIKRGEFEVLNNVASIGSALISYRIYLGMNQSELAQKLGVSESQVSRDEKNEYYGSSIEKISAVMEALSMNVILTIQK